jgi:hypothetical protein
MASLVLLMVASGVSVQAAPSVLRDVADLQREHLPTPPVGDGTENILVAALTHEISAMGRTFYATTTTPAEPAPSAGKPPTPGVTGNRESGSIAPTAPGQTLDMQWTSQDHGRIEGDAKTPKGAGGAKSGAIVAARVAQSAGFILPQIDSVGEILKSFFDYGNIGSNDIVFINVGSRNEIQVGAKYYIYNVDDFVFHPDPTAVFPERVTPPAEINSRYSDLQIGKKGPPIGYLVHVAGMLEVLDVGEDTAKAVIRESYDAIRGGDKLTPYFEVRPPVRPAAGEIKDIDAYVVASRDPANALGDHNIVYLDKGSRQNVEPGDVFDVYFVPKMEVRSWYKTENPLDLAPHVFGRVQVIATQDNTATAVVLGSESAIHVGDLLRSRGQLSSRR